MVQIPKPTKYVFLNEVDQYNYVKTLGVVLSTQSTQQFFAFQYSDSIDVAQAVLFIEPNEYQYFRMPEQGDSVIVNGNFYEKDVGGQKLKKINVESFKVISIREEFLIYDKMLQARRIQSQNQENNVADQQHRAVPNINKLPAFDIKSIGAIQTKTLVLNCLYSVFINNPDIMNFLFFAQTFKNHNIAKKYLEGKKKANDRIAQQHLLPIIKKGIQELLKHKCLNQYIRVNKVKQPIIESQFVFQRKFFTMLGTRMYDYIKEGKQYGVVVQELLKRVHQNDLKIIDKSQYLFDQQLLFLILTVWCDQNKIWKNSQKRIFLKTLGTN